VSRVNPVASEVTGRYLSVGVLTVKNHHEHGHPPFENCFRNSDT